MRYTLLNKATVHYPKIVHSCSLWSNNPSCTNTLNSALVNFHSRVFVHYEWTQACGLIVTNYVGWNDIAWQVWIASFLAHLSSSPDSHMHCLQLPTCMLLYVLWEHKPYVHGGMRWRGMHKQWKMKCPEWSLGKKSHRRSGYSWGGNTMASFVSIGCLMWIFLNTQLVSETIKGLREWVRKVRRNNLYLFADKVSNAWQGQKRHSSTTWVHCQRHWSHEMNE